MLSRPQNLRQEITTLTIKQGEEAFYNEKHRNPYNPGSEPLAYTSWRTGYDRARMQADKRA